MIYAINDITGNVNSLIIIAFGNSSDCSTVESVVGGGHSNIDLIAENTGAINDVRGSSSIITARYLFRKSKTHLKSINLYVHVTVAANNGGGQIEIKGESVAVLNGYRGVTGEEYRW